MQEWRAQLSCLYGLCVCSFFPPAHTLGSSDLVTPTPIPEVPYAPCHVPSVSMTQQLSALLSLGVCKAEYLKSHMKSAAMGKVLRFYYH